MWFYRHRRRLLIMGVVAIGYSLMMNSCMTFRMNAREVDEFFTTRKIPYERSQYQAGPRQMTYLAAGDSLKPPVLFVHGSPGSSSAFIDFLGDSVLLQHFFLISVDRPGFGYSGFGHAEKTLQAQSDAIGPLLDRYHTSGKFTLVGHSLGGPLIVKLAHDYPQYTGKLIIVAGSIDPELEPNETWFRAPLATPFLSWLLPRSMRASNEEIYHLKPELEKLVPAYSHITVPVTVIQGTKDSLVPEGNAAFAEKHFTSAPLSVERIPGVDHFIPWSHPHLIQQALLKNK